MTLQEAVKILNKKRHRGQDNWAPWDDGVVPSHGESFDFLTKFEAVAIAEKYHRYGFSIDEPADPTAYNGDAVFVIEP